MAAVDRSQGGFGEPASYAYAVTPDDDNDIAYTSRALYVGDVSGGADLAVVMHGGDAVTFEGLTAGTILPIRVTRVKSTGTSATAILALY